MRVLYFSPYPPVRDGIGSYTWMLSNAIKDGGAETAVVIPRRVPEARDEVIGTLLVRGDGYRRLREAVRAWNPDIIHVQFAIAAFGTRTLVLLRWLALLRRDLQVPVVVTFHEYARESAMLPVVGRVLHRRLASQCDRLIVHTTGALTGVITDCGQSASKVVLIPHPRAEPPPSTSSASDLRARFKLGNARVLLAFGFINVDKGLDDLVRALGIIQRASPGLLHNVRLVVAGAVRRRNGVFRIFEARDRVHLVRVKSLIWRLGLQRRLVMTGYVPVGDVAGWFNLADAAVLPYRRAEQSGVAGLALSFGTPVLASDAGGLAEQLTATRWTFPPAAPARLAETLKRFLMAQPAERTEISSRCGSANELVSVAANTLDLYRAANAERHRGSTNVA
jgi:glycosyltransferase involved in cell wall biosynthesis